MDGSHKIPNEAALVEAFIGCIESRNANKFLEDDWAVYPETAGFDLVLVDRRSGVQVGVEAKMTLNLKVVEQALCGAFSGSRYGENVGPDYRAVLVPNGPSVQRGLGSVMRQLGLTILRVYDQRCSWNLSHKPEWTCIPHLPDENEDGSWSLKNWFAWLPEKRLALPDYIPDVPAGVKSPVSLTVWKVKAIKLLILLEKRGAVHRSDMRALDIAPTIWTKPDGFLEPTPKGYVRCDRTPDLRSQHPKNYAEIEADFDKWNPYAGLAA